MNYQVLLYYKYTTIDDPEQFAQDHLAFCKAHHLKGRILVLQKVLTAHYLVQRRNRTIYGTYACR